MFANDNFDDELDEQEAESPSSGGSSRLILWLIIVGLGIFFIPLHLLSTTLAESKAPLETELADLQATLTITPPPDPTEQALRENLLQLRSQAGELETLYDDLTTNHIDWPSAMAVIANYDVSQMVFTGLEQTGTLVTFHGRANDETVVMVYADMLRASGRFGEVKVQAITLVTLPTPTPMPTEVVGGLYPPATPVNVAEFIISVELTKAS